MADEPGVYVPHPADEEPSYTFYYHPIGFRGNFVRHLLAFQNIPFVQATTDELREIRKITPEDAASSNGPLFMAPPLLHDERNDLYLSQMPVIVQYLSRRHGLAPSDPIQLAIGEKILHDCNDILNEVTRNCGAQMWTNARQWSEFRDKRFKKWLQILEETGKRRGLGASSGYYLGTGKATFADLAIFSLLWTMEEGLAALSQFLRDTAPCCMALCDRLLHESLPLSGFCTRHMNKDVYCGGYIEASLKRVITEADADAIHARRHRLHAELKRLRHAYVVPTQNRGADARFVARQLGEEGEYLNAIVESSEKTLESMNAILASGEHVDLHTDDAFLTQLGGIEAALKHMAEQDEEVEAEVKQRHNTPEAAALKSIEQQDTAAREQSEEDRAQSTNTTDDDFVHVASSAAGAEYAEAMESVLHQHEAALRAEKQAKQLKYKIRHWRATFLKPAQNAVKDCKFVMAQLGDIPGTAPVKRKMSRCAQAAEGMAAIIDHAENYLMEKPMTDEEFADQIFAAEGALSRQAELLQDVKDESASGDGDGGS